MQPPSGARCVTGIGHGRKISKVPQFHRLYLQSTSPDEPTDKMTEAGMAYPTRLIPATVVGRVTGPLPFR